MDKPPSTALTHVLTRYWADLVFSDFARLNPDNTVAVLPLAATEQHGPHLPLDVDRALLDGVIQAALPLLPDGLPVYFLPTQAVGYSVEHGRFPGTLSLEPDTVLRLWIELGASVARAGVRKLLLFNGHGGQVGLMDVVARELRSKHQMLVYSASWFSLPLGPEIDALFSADEQRFGIHAGDIETSMMLHLHPGRVRMDQAQNFRSTAQLRALRFAVLGNGRSAKLGWEIQDYNAAGAVGHAAAATAEKGELMVQAAGKQLVVLLQELADLPLSTLTRSKGSVG